MVIPEIVFGIGAREHAARYIKLMGGKKVLIVTDNGIIEAGWIDELQKELNHQQIAYHVFSGVTPNPKSREVMNGVKAFRKENCDLILAYGGGSPIDCAKGIGISAMNGKNILNYEGVDKIKIPIPPLICIPTTAGTSADISQFAIIADEKRKVKIAIISKAIVPDISLIDPFTLTTMDDTLTAATGMDAFSHAMEAVASNASFHITDLHALDALKLINENLIKCHNDPGNMEYRKNMMLASMQAGVAFSSASLGCVHALAHSIGGYSDSPHGECNAILLKYVVDFNFDSASEKYTSAALALGYKGSKTNLADIKKFIMDRIEYLLDRLSLPDKLSEMGITKNDFNKLAESAYEDPCLLTNPRQAAVSDLRAILTAAL